MKVTITLIAILSLLHLTSFAQKVEDQSYIQFVHIGNSDSPMWNLYISKEGDTLKLTRDYSIQFWVDDLLYDKLKQQLKNYRNTKADTSNTSRSIYCFYCYMIETIENGVNTNAFIIKTDVESELFFRELTKSIPQKIKNERLRREFQIGIILNIRGRRDYELFEWFAMHRELAWGFYNLL